MTVQCLILPKSGCGISSRLNMIRKLLARDFTDETVGGIIRRGMARSAPHLQLNPAHYFPFVHNGMSNEMVAAWRGDDSVLVAMFYPQIFTGKMVGVVSLWAGEGADTTRLLTAFEQEARSRGCVSMHASSFGWNRAVAMGYLYRRKGYEPEEISFTKDI